MADRKIIILYGSQTGTAQDLAERIWREAKFFGFTGPFLCMDDYKPEELIYEPLVVFVAATTGQGEEPDNMKQFWKFLLRKSLPIDSLKSTRFAGLGDSSYLKFNFVAKRLTRRLSNLGGIPIVETGYADDQHDLGIDAVVDKWLANLWGVLAELYHFTAGPVSLSPVPRWRVSIKDGGAANHSFKESDVGKDEGNYSQRNPCSMYILENHRTTSQNHFQDVRLLKLKIPPTVRYNPGDVLMLAPQNSDVNVKFLFEILNHGRQEDEKILENSFVQVEQRDKDLVVPGPLRSPISLKECAKKYWDLSAVPRRRVFSILAHVTSSEMERDKLQEFSEASGQEDLYNYCNRPKRNILEVLSDFPNATRCLTLDLLFDVLQPIRPRAFSIASSPKKHEGEVHVLLAVVQYKTKLLKPREGLCSTYLANLSEGCVVYGWTRPGSFRFPPPGSPVIMVGPGTGVAPFRSYVQELAAQNDASSSDLLLFFGCRNKSADFHFQEEWNTLVANNGLSFVSAFSRDQPDKIYVQHRIEELGPKVWEMLSRQGFIYVAGSSKNMPTSVREAFVKVVQLYGNMDSQKAEAFISTLERTGHYQTETWS